MYASIIYAIMYCISFVVFWKVLEFKLVGLFSFCKSDSNTCIHKNLGNLGKRKLHMIRLCAYTCTCTYHLSVRNIMPDVGQEENLICRV